MLVFPKKCVSEYSNNMSFNYLQICAKVWLANQTGSVSFLILVQMVLFISLLSKLSMRILKNLKKEKSGFELPEETI